MSNITVEFQKINLTNNKVWCTAEQQKAANHNKSKTESSKTPQSNQINPNLDSEAVISANDL